MRFGSEDATKEAGRPGLARLAYTQVRINALFADGVASVDIATAIVAAAQPFTALADVGGPQRKACVKWCKLPGAGVDMTTLPWSKWDNAHGSGSMEAEQAKYEEVAGQAAGSSSSSAAVAIQPISDDDDSQAAPQQPPSSSSAAAVVNKFDYSEILVHELQRTAPVPENASLSEFKKDAQWGSVEQKGIVERYPPSKGCVSEGKKLQYMKKVLSSWTVNDACIAWKVGITGSPRQRFTDYQTGKWRSSCVDWWNLMVLVGKVSCHESAGYIEEALIRYMQDDVKAPFSEQAPHDCGGLGPYFEGEGFIYLILKRCRVDMFHGQIALKNKELGIVKEQLKAAQERVQKLEQMELLDELVHAELTFGQAASKIRDSEVAELQKQVSSLSKENERLKKKAVRRDGFDEQIRSLRKRMERLMPEPKEEEATPAEKEEEEDEEQEEEEAEEMADELVAAEERRRRMRSD